MMAARNRRNLGAGAALLLLAGCLGLGGKPPAVLFDLVPARTPTAGTGASGSAANAIVVLEPVADAQLSVARVAVHQPGGTIAYLKGAAWADRPAHLFGQLIAEALRARGGRLVIEGEAPGGAMRLGGRLIDLGLDVSGGKPGAVVVRFEAVRERGTAIDTRRFEHTAPVRDATPAEIGDALNRAANAVAGDVADWAG